MEPTWPSPPPHAFLGGCGPHGRTANPGGELEPGEGSGRRGCSCRIAPSAQPRRDAGDPRPGHRRAPAARAATAWLEPSRRGSPLFSRPSPGPAASRSVLPDSGMVGSETREASSRTQCRPPGVRTRRAATCSTTPGVGVGAGCGRKDPAIPWVPHGPGSRQAGTTPNPSAHIPSRNSGGSPHSGHPRAVTSFPVSPPQPQPQPRRRPPGPRARPAPPVGRRPEIPAVKMQRAKRALQTMVPRCAVPSSATDRALGARPAPPLPRWRPWEPGGEGGSARSGSGCSGEGRRSETSAARLRQRRVLRRPARFCSIPAARAWAASAAARAPAKPLPPGPRGADEASPWPPLSRRSGPRSLGPGRPLLDRGGTGFRERPGV